MLFCQTRIAPTTAKESWNPEVKSWFVSKARIRSAAPARLLSARTGRSKKIPPSKNAAMVAARKLETCKPVIAE